MLSWRVFLLVWLILQGGDKWKKSGSSVVYSDPDSPADPQGLGTTRAMFPSFIHTDLAQWFSQLGSLDHHISILWENNGNALLKVHSRFRRTARVGPSPLCFNKPSLMPFQVWEPNLIGCLGYPMQVYSQWGRDSGLAYSMSYCKTNMLFASPASQFLRNSWNSGSQATLDICVCRWRTELELW